MWICCLKLKTLLIGIVVWRHCEVIWHNVKWLFENIVKWLFEDTDKLFFEIIWSYYLNTLLFEDMWSCYLFEDIVKLLFERFVMLLFQDFVKLLFEDIVKLLFQGGTLKTLKEQDAESLQAKWCVANSITRHNPQLPLRYSAQHTYRGDYPRPPISCHVKM